MTKILSALLFLPVMTINCYSQENNKVEWIKYTDSAYMFEVDYLTDWNEIIYDRILNSQEMKLRKNNGTLFFNQEYKI